MFQAYRLKKWWSKYSRFWVTVPGEDTEHLLRDETVCYAHYPESRNLTNALRNMLLAYQILRRKRPDIIISTGAGIAPPFFLVGKLLGMKLIYIEPYDFISRPTLTGRMVQYLVHALFVQHRKQKRFYPKGIFKGSLL